MREGDSKPADSTAVAEESRDDASYLAMLFSDLGDFPPVERPGEQTPAADASPKPAENGAAKAEVAEQPVSKVALAVRPVPMRPFIDEVLNTRSVPVAPSSRGNRWRTAALSFVGLLAVGGTAVAVLSLGYQQNARSREVVRASAVVPAKAPQQNELAAVAGATTPATGFQGCTNGKGLSPAGLILVAKNFVSTTGPPAVCLPAEQTQKPAPARDAATSEPSPAENPTVAVVGPAPADSRGSGASPAPRSGSGGSTSPGTGSGGSTDPGGDTGTGGGDTGSGTDGGGVIPPEDGTTDDGKTHGKGWGKGGKKGRKPLGDRT